MKCQKSSRLRCYQNWSPTVEEPLNTLKNRNSDLIHGMFCVWSTFQVRCHVALKDFSSARELAQRALKLQHYEAREICKAEGV